MNDVRTNEAQTAARLVDLRHYIRTYDHDLEPEFCQQTIQTFEQLRCFQLRNGRGVRRGLEESAWTEINVTRFSSPELLQALARRIAHAVDRYNRDLELALPIPMSSQVADLVLKRYRSSERERFQLHFDAAYHLANRYLVLLWYLNDVPEGGETRFPQLEVSIVPRAGRLLMFPPYWMYQHEGLAPRRGEKFILSTYLLFASAGQTQVGSS